ncbi:hypothetical protein [Pseudoclavibacter helvolus]|uniref:hypothetical protein n=1 Tax=Pseudoclavibacter helvolus TaxID=255205 RepID=UPI0037356CCE
MADDIVYSVFPAFNPASTPPSAELVPAAAALAALTLRCARIRYLGAQGQAFVKDIQWVPLATRPMDGLSWLLWEKMPPCYPNSLRELPATGRESAAVFVDGHRYLADRRNYLTDNYARLQPGAWMAN